MKKEAQLIITETDFEKLTSLVNINRSETSELLEVELSRATVVPDDKLPKDVVAMNSTVKYTDVESKKDSVLTLVYPHDASIEEKKVSVLAPMGSALIGLKVGQTIQWPMPNGNTKKIKVTSVSHDND